jgi:hypothetical protein
MNAERTRRYIRESAQEIVRLRGRIDELRAQIDHGEERRNAWRDACSEFHARYNQLAFPGGFDGAYERILEGDPIAMEAAICFLEVRPYFFRSGYIYKDLLHECKRAPLSPEQRARFIDLIERYGEYRRRIVKARQG